MKSIFNEKSFYSLVSPWPNELKKGILEKNGQQNSSSRNNMNNKQINNNDDEKNKSSKDKTGTISVRKGATDIATLLKARKIFSTNTTLLKLD